MPLDPPRDDRRRPGRDQDGRRGRRLRAAHPLRGQGVLDRADRGASWSRTSARELEEAREARPDVLAAGLGIPATIDHDRGVAIQAVNLEISDVPLRDLMRERIGLPVYMDNDANVAALAEFLFGAGRGHATWSC